MSKAMTTKFSSAGVSSVPVIPINGEEAVRWRSLEQLIIEARSAFIDMEPGAIESLIEEAVAATRLAPSE